LFCGYSRPIDVCRAHTYLYKFFHRYHFFKGSHGYKYFPVANKTLDENKLSFRNRTPTVLLANVSLSACENPRLPTDRLCGRQTEQNFPSNSFSHSFIKMPRDANVEKTTGKVKSYSKARSFSHLRFWSFVHATQRQHKR
jgi:hypothetical protein